MRRNAFRTGDIAEFMGITNMGVLYLEKRGLLKADREENGYRSYSTQTTAWPSRPTRRYCSSRPTAWRRAPFQKSTFPSKNLLTLNLLYSL